MKSRKDFLYRTGSLFYVQIVLWRLLCYNVVDLNKPIKEFLMNKNERYAQIGSFLGQIVTVEVDRPKGSAHPDYPELVYPVHYGYIPDKMGGDGEAQDAYLLGVDSPVQSYTGRVIGVIHRLNDCEDKLVVAPPDLRLHQAEIEAAVRFQEQYFHIQIESYYHKSCGVIPYHLNEQRIEYLLLFQCGSHTWSFPKGHAEIGETEIQTALRETAEETGLTVYPAKGFRTEVYYPICPIGEKNVVLFLAETAGTVIFPKTEIEEAKWVSSEKAQTLLIPAYKNALVQAENWIKRSVL